MFLPVFVLFTLAATAVDGKLDPSGDVPDISLPNYFDEFNPQDTGNEPDWSRYVYLTSVFSRAKFDPLCAESPRVFIEVVYYNPGNRVDLDCKMCHRVHVFNGQPKQWRIMRQNIQQSILDLKPNNRGWKILDAKVVEEFHGTNPENFVRMPDEEQRAQYEDLKFPPKTQFFQRDGKLVILHPGMDAYGLYTCFDDESRNVLKHAYLLVPMTPLYIQEHWKSNLFECAKSIDSFWRLDEHHLFHFLPTVLPPDASLCTPDENTGEDCSAAVMNVKSQPPMDDVARIYFSEHEDDVERIKKKTNLKVAVHWSAWSSCKDTRKVKTRTGACHLKKVDEKVKFEDDGSLHGNFPVDRIHNLIENVAEFRLNGIPLFSGIMADLLNVNDESASHCTVYSRQRWTFFEQGIFQKIASNTNETLRILKDQWNLKDYTVVDSLCFHSVAIDRTGNQGRVIYGSKLIQNQPC